MQTILKWIGIVLAALLGLALIGLLVLYFIGNARLNRVYDFPPSNLLIPTDAETIALGKHRAETLCTGCHAGDLGGEIGWMNAGPVGRIDSPNLTNGLGGIGREYKTTDDYVRAIRHGVDPQGKPLFMPAVVTLQTLSDTDLSAIIAYLKTAPPVDRPNNGQQFGLLAKVLFGANLFGELPVQAVDHNAAHPPSPPHAADIAYGQYLVAIIGCRSCHGEQLAGGKYPDPSITMISPNLTPGGRLSKWTFANFATTLRTGVTPDGRSLNNDLMPWQDFGKLDDIELKAMYLYLRSLPNFAQQIE